MQRRHVAAASVVAAATMIGLVGPQATGASGAVGAPPSPESFVNTTLAVIAGSQVSLHWHAAQNESFLVTSTAPTAVPNFGSGSRVAWPAGTSSTWNGQWWSTTASAMTLTIPWTARTGTTYRIQLATCYQATLSCSNSLGASGLTQVMITVAGGWVSTSLWSDFSRLTRIAAQGSPLDVAWSPDDSIWATSEFSAGVSQVPPSSSSSIALANVTNLRSTPFAVCFSGPCASSGASALSERTVTANGLVWYSQGGWLWDTNTTVPNHSDIVALNPGANTTCTYVAPGNSNDVIGMAVVGTRPNSSVWFAESDIMNGDVYLDSFNPDTVGDGCPGTTSESYILGDNLMRIPWPGAGSPAQIAVDPSLNALWVTDWIGSAVYRLDLGTDTFAVFPLHSTNASSFFGAEPWDVVSDGRYVYAIDYGDNNLVRISPSTGVVDEVPIPVTSDSEQGYGLALSAGKLYFTLSDDGQPSFGGSSTFGYIDVAGWEAASAGCAPGSDCAPSPPLGVIYRLPAFAQSDLRGIAVDAQGRVALADLHQLVRLSP